MARPQAITVQEAHWPLSSERSTAPIDELRRCRLLGPTTTTDTINRHYRPRPMAAGPKTNVSRLVPLVCDEIHRPFNCRNTGLVGHLVRDGDLMELHPHRFERSPLLGLVRIATFTQRQY